MHRRSGATTAWLQKSIWPDECSLAAFIQVSPLEVDSENCATMGCRSDDGPSQVHAVVSLRSSFLFTVGEERSRAVEQDGEAGTDLNCAIPRSVRK